MPAPPPPPMLGGPPPPPVPAAFPKGGGGGDNIGALLKSIQKGTKLKKAVTNDRSAPIVSNKPTNNNNGVSSGTPSKPSGGGMASPNGMNLGGLFAGGMPKLRPTGKLNSSNESEQRESRPQQSRNPTRQVAPDIRNRGPPPPAPTRIVGNENDFALKSTSNGTSTNSSYHQSTPNLTMQNSSLHRNVKSNTNLNSLDSPDAKTNGFHHGNNNKPVISHGKPNLAPKPPAFNVGKPRPPPTKLIMNGKPVNRTQSMKSPGAPSPESPDPLSTMKFGTVRNLSSVIGQSLATTGSLSVASTHSRSRPALNGRPNAPPPSIPSQVPPPPHGMSSPAYKVKPPNHAPPPPPPLATIPQPPSHTPPPPPHRTMPMPTRAPPAVPSVNNIGAPPPPPRHSSMATSRKAGPSDFDEKFRNMFQSPNTFPRPPPFRNAYKFNGHKVGSKQQAPQPPHLQSTSRTWETSSTC